jgi:hypothetical protein
MAYDAFRHDVVLFGGVGGSDFSQPLNDTWTFQGRRWTERDPVTRPDPLGSAQMAYDDRTHTCLLVWSGQRTGPAVTWSWDGTTWSRVLDVPFGVNETLQALASDPATGHVLLISVVTAINNLSPTPTRTWTWDGRAWTLRQPPQPFPVVPVASFSGPTLASIGARAPGRLGRGVLAVFDNGDGTTRTWFWDGSTWSQRAVGPTPPYYPLGATMAEDAASEDVVLIGWGDGAGDPGSTWLWDGTRWREAGPAPFLNFLYGGTSTLSDSASAHAIVIGDRNPGGQPSQFDVLWTFDGHEWVSDRPA